MNESAEQIALFKWAAAKQGKHPKLKMLFAIPNGGFRNKAEAGRLKAEGVKAGYPDIGLDVAVGKYHGLRIELKRPKSLNVAPGVLSHDQKRWIADLTEEGYYATACWGWTAAAEVIAEYLVLPADTIDWARTKAEEDARVASVRKLRSVTGMRW